MPDEPRNVPPDHSASATSAYRAYLIGRDGRVGTSITVMAQDDEAAIRQVEELTRTYEIELWDRSRVVIRLPSKTKR